MRRSGTSSRASAARRSTRRATDSSRRASDGPARAIRCACAIRDAVGSLGLGIRVGVHTGECDVVDGKLAGLAVAVGARVAAGEVLVSGTVKDLVAGSGIAFDTRGVDELKGLGELPLYAVAALD
jgi:class 3 adenylate cyclase